MVSTQKKTQSNGGLFGQLSDFDHDIVFGHAANNEQQNVVANDGTIDRGLTVNNSGSVSMKKIDREKGNNVDTVENRMQNENLTAIGNFINPRIEVASSQ